MRKDVKVGMLVGAAILIAASVWVSMRLGLSRESEPAFTSFPEVNPDTQLEPDIPVVETSRTETNEWQPGTPAFSSPEQTVTAESSQGSSQSNEPALVVTEQSVPTVVELNQPEKVEIATAQRVHMVAEGETLSSISEKYYGTPNKWQKIYEANKGILRSPDKIKPGMKLTIPD